LAGTMLPSPSNIRVFVQWSEQTVFAGEDIKCQIIFKNVAAVPNEARSSSHSGSLNGFAPGGGRGRKGNPLQTPTAQGKNTVSQNSRAVPSGRGHRSALSLNVPVGSGRSNQGSGLRSSGHIEVGTEDRSHKRSVSIISLGISEDPGVEAIAQLNVAEGSRRPSRGHIRASSLQIVPRRSGTNGAGPLSGRS
jgi:RAB6A-GEF complex partner protein 2